MEKLVEELKNEILNKEFELLELDNIVQRELNTDSSIFDSEEDCLRNSSCSYYLDTIDENEENGIVVVDWENVQNNENTHKKVVKVTDIYKF